MLASPKDNAELSKLIDEGATEEDLVAGIAWKTAHNNGKAIRYFYEVVGPTRTAVLKRKQGGLIPQKENPFDAVLREYQ